jgi:F420H(2)-dependent biliverdin reductase
MKLDEKVSEFVRRPLFAKIATVKKNGAPHVTPIWFMHQDGVFIVNAKADRLKVKNLEREPRVALLIDDAYQYVLVQGRAEFAKDRDAQEDIKSLAIRYLGRDKGERDAREIYSKQKRVTIVITPGKVVAKDL